MAHKKILSHLGASELQNFTYFPKASDEASEKRTTRPAQKLFWKHVLCLRWNHIKSFWIFSSTFLLRRLRLLLILFLFSQFFFVDSRVNRNRFTHSKAFWNKVWKSLVMSFSVAKQTSEKFHTKVKKSWNRIKSER